VREGTGAGVHDTVEVSEDDVDAVQRSRSSLREQSHSGALLRALLDLRVPLDLLGGSRLVSGLVLA
jgi:hypothetical protein